eukprot:TRINITY_DN2359_c1_g1_i1.p1 TRINITY_DN2359_c1_g1~~TRINITY_DN2359_c1_g1_i1.p1  ORF type:complete len:129 (+),score=19.16 TRINITY_DN2359_c1_g1_i1:476-862(+)
MAAVNVPPTITSPDASSRATEYAVADRAPMPPLAHRCARESTRERRVRAHRCASGGIGALSATAYSVALDDASGDVIVGGTFTAAILHFTGTDGCVFIKKTKGRRKSTQQLYTDTPLSGLLHTASSGR